ncbi:LuxR C-terminal-related transcriptional regulator [Gordonia sp. ABSL1-1]|uniref:LuxR family transcriptional regulator n=1 Tax=Gordonia sp. ABSL1-1 TaxID=3053923 RepID=UPI0025737B11|nr:LuxR family transcriptional regulator [Gordonia sp. ABSL1-1]MDL9938154.1 LuxR C-terminal-related transcriptional regulator [Gordonia sp. ABSL1-1]
MSASQVEVDVVSVFPGSGWVESVEVDSIEVGSVDAESATVTLPRGLTLIVGDRTRASAQGIDAAVAAARRSGALVLRHRFTADGARPFGALQSLLHHVVLPTGVPEPRIALRRVRRLVGSHAPDVLAVIGGLVELCRAAEPIGPVVVLLNDLDLIDRASANVLAGVARRLHDQPIAIVATASADAPIDHRIVTRVRRSTADDSVAIPPDSCPDTTEATRRALAELRSGEIDRAANELEGAVGAATDSGTRGRLLAAAAGVAADLTGNLDQVALLLRQALSADRSASTSLEAQVAYVHLGLGDGSRLTTLAQSIAAGLRDHDRIAGRWVLDEALWAMFLVACSAECDDIWEMFRNKTSWLGDRCPPWARVAASAASTVSAGPPGATRVMRTLAHTDDPAQIIRIAFATRGGERDYWWRNGLERIWSRRYPTASAIYAGVMLSADALDAGDWRRAESIASEGLGLCGNRDHHSCSEVWMHHLLGILDAHRGHHSTALEHSAFVTSWSTTRGAHRLRDRAVHIRAACALAADHPRRAHRLLAGLGGGADYGILADIDDRTAVDLAEAAQRADDQAHLGVLRKRLTVALDRIGAGDMASGIGKPRSRAAMSYLAALAITTSDVDTFARALAVPDSDRWPFVTARLRLALARVLSGRRAPGDAGRAAEHLRQAALTFQLLDASPWLAQVRRELRTLGVDVGSSSRAGFVRLSATEQRIAEMASSGRTNREIAAQLVMSPSTVSTHLHHVYRVLGVRSRVGLREVLRPAQVSGGQSTSASRSPSREVTDSFA